jgi:hypothetical protein
MMQRGLWGGSDGMQVCYMVIDETDSAKTILKKLKGFDGDVHLSATQLRSFLHELQKRRKQMSKPQKNNKK